MSRLFVNFSAPGMSSEYTQLSEDYSLEYPVSPQSSSDRGSPAHSLPSASIVPYRSRQLSLPDISPLSISGNTADSGTSGNPYPQPPTYRFPDCEHTSMPREDYKFPVDNSHTPKASERPSIAHPYARLYAKQEPKKRPRKIWNHKLEKRVFTEHELWVPSVPIWYHC